MSNGLIRTRINENVLKVQNEGENVKGLLSTAVTYTKADNEPTYAMTMSRDMDI